MNARMLGIICALLAAIPNLIGCESPRSQDYQFEKQVKRAQECRQFQGLTDDELVLKLATFLRSLEWRQGLTDDELVLKLATFKRAPECRQILVKPEVGRSRQ